MNNTTLIKDLLLDYGAHQEQAAERIKARLEALEETDAELSARLSRIMDLWTGMRQDLPISYEILPDGLPESNELCLVVLGYQLEKDGSMREELIGRLEVTLKSAQKYPNAHVLCSGGGTAAENAGVSEAGQMAAWLVAHGVEEKRIIVENNSRTTGQNAICSYDLLTKNYPFIKQLAVITSDYHVLGGMLLLRSEAILKADVIGEEGLQVVANAAWRAPHTPYPPSYQAYALIELCTDFQKTREI